MRRPYPTVRCSSRAHARKNSVLHSNVQQQSSTPSSHCNGADRGLLTASFDCGCRRLIPRWPEATMFLIDDLLNAPGKAILFVFQELARKAQEELLDDESVKRELQEIYNLLSSGKISEAEFEGRENGLLERLEQIAKLKFQSKPGADATAPHPVPVIESQFDIAPLSAPDSQDFTLNADVFKALRSLSHLVSPVGSADSVPELASPTLTISDKGPQRSERSLSELAAVADHVQSSCEPMPAAVVESV